MAAITTMLAVAAVGIGAVATYQGYQGRKDAAKAYASAAKEETKARNQQRADNYQQQAAERRSQVREERIRRARLLQASENSGTSGGSGEMGALGSLSTQLNANIGMNLGRAMSGDLISGYMQNAANFNTAAQRSTMQAQNADAIAGLSMSIFGAAGGFGAFGKGK